MSVTAEDVTRAVAQEVALCLDACLERVVHCVDQLTEQQIWWRPEESMNSIGNLILHLTGNLQQWMVAGLGGLSDSRNRPAEFSERGPIPASQLLSQLSEVVEKAKRVLSTMTAEQMLARRRIQGFDVTGWGAVFDSVPHLKGHTQEIICLTRLQLRDRYRFHWEPRSPEQGAAGEGGAETKETN